MRLLTRTITIALLVALVVTVGTATVVVGTHRPSERAYLQYVRTYGSYGGPDDPSVAKASRRELLNGGSRACGWLRDQPVALWRDDRRFRINDLYVRYRRAAGEQDDHLPAAFLPGAFTYLCPLSSYLRKPHLGSLHRDADTGATD